MIRKVALAAFVLLLIGFAAAYFALPRRVEVTPEVVDRIKLGMTHAEVEALLGGPPGDYTGGRFVVRYHEVKNDPMNEKFITYKSVRVWVSENGAAWIRVDDDERVYRKGFSAVKGLDEMSGARDNWWEALLRRFHAPNYSERIILDPAAAFWPPGEGLQLK